MLVFGHFRSKPVRGFSELELARYAVLGVFQLAKVAHTGPVLEEWRQFYQDVLAEASRILSGLPMRRQAILVSAAGIRLVNRPRSPK